MAPGNSIDNGPAISQSRMDGPPRMIIEFGIPGAGRGGERGDVVVVVDAIRATTTIPLMLSRGAVKVIPCESRAAVEAARPNWPGALRAGERECRRIEGYDMGSSPTEISGMELAGATILHSTTNGTRAVRAALEGGAAEVLAGSLATVTATSAAVLDLLRQRAPGSNKGPAASPTAETPGLTLVATGRLGRFTSEDWLGCRFIAARIGELAARSANLASRRRGLFKEMKAKWTHPLDENELLDTIMDSPSVAAVTEAGLEADLDHCLAVDSLAVAPWFDGDGFVDYWEEDLRSRWGKVRKSRNL